MHALTGAELGHAVRAAAAKGHLQNQPRVFAELKQRALYLLPTLQPKTRVFVFAGFAKCLEASTQSSFSTEGKEGKTFLAHCLINYFSISGHLQQEEEVENPMEEWDPFSST